MDKDGSKVRRTIEFAGSNIIAAGLFRLVIGLFTAGICGAVGLLVTRVDDSHTQITSMIAKMDYLMATVTNNSLRVDTLNDRMTRLETRYDDRGAR